MATKTYGDDRDRAEVIEALATLDKVQAEIDAEFTRMGEFTRIAVAANAAGEQKRLDTAMEHQRISGLLLDRLMLDRREATARIASLTGRKYAINRRKDGTHSLAKTTWKIAR